MIKARVRHTDFPGKEIPESEGWVIENMKDLDEYTKFLNSVGKRVATKIITSTLPPDKIEHMSFSEAEKGIAQMVKVRSMLSGRSPLFEVDGSVSTKLISMHRVLLNKGPLFVNEAGGFRPIKGLEVIQYLDGELKNERRARIRKSKYIVLENDPFMPKESIEMASALDSEYSEICDMRSWAGNEFDALLRNFVEKGGEAAFVYTTGYDHEQMHWYTRRLLDAGIKKIKFRFTAGISSGISEYLSFFDSKIKISII